MGRRVSDSPSCGIFVFECRTDQLAESDGIAVRAEKMPAFGVSCLFWFDIQCFALEIAGQALVRYRKGDDCLGVILMQSQCKRF